MQVLGLDIGGANLKAACSDGRSLSRPFSIWKYPERLAAEIRSLETQLASQTDVFAVTMTAELADCFETKAAGVAHILAAVQEVAGSRQVLVWLTDGRFSTPDEALKHPLSAAASNWQALATWATRLVGTPPTILIDIGTTTTDLIPLDGGQVAAKGRTDVTRLLAGELVYTGVRRTPLCAVASAVPFQGSMCPLSAELFATTLDVYLCLDQISEDVTDLETANGRTATKAAAHDRLARQLCCDRDELNVAEATVIARFIAEKQRAQISKALNQVLQARPPREAVIISGSGSFLAKQIVAEHPQLKNASLIEIGRQGRDNPAVAACAHAVAVLAEEHLVGRPFQADGKSARQT